MERTIDSLVGCRMEARDGEVGKVEDIYFDDESWKVRYLVLKTEDWLSGRKVLIAPAALLEGNSMAGVFRVNLTQDQIRHSPGIDTDKPVSRQQEIELYGHYAWKGYWESGFYAGGLGSVVDGLPEKGRRLGADLHLRSSLYVSGFPVHGTDGEIGSVCHFLIDDRTWEVLGLVVNTSRIPDGKKVVVGVGHIIQMKWSDSDIYLNETKADIEKSKQYDPPVFSGPPTAL
ncbi:MAG: PRC-barrel domain-containing protein [Puia sp.]|nr:PRC-barrel domain-containing protein [Puia sp.]